MKYRAMEVPVHILLPSVVFGYILSIHGKFEREK